MSNQELVTIAEFALLGLIAGTYGALVGAGGGFLIVPILLLFFEFAPRNAAATSLAVVFCSAVSGTLAFLKQRRIDYATGWRFALATLPGALIGPTLVRFIPADLFKILFGLLLVVLAIFLNLRPDPSSAKLAAPGSGPLPSGWVRRSLVDARGVEHQYAFNLRNGIILSVLIGFVSSLAGIGGGIIHVPAMVFLFGFPAHLAAATSQFALVFTSLVGSLGYLAQGDILLVPAAAMAAGAIVGARVGATIAQRVKGRVIVRILSLALVAAGLRLIYDGLT